MADGKSVPQQGLEGGQRSGLFGHARRVQDHPGGEGHEMGAEAPHVNVLHAADARKALKGLRHFRQMEPRGDALQEEVQGFPKKGEGAAEDQRGDHQTDERVHRPPPRGGDEGARGDHADAGQGVRGHVQKGAPQIHVGAAGSVKGRGHGDVGRQSGQAQPHHPTGARERRGSVESVEGFPGDAQGHARHQKAVGHGGQDFQPMQAEGSPVRGGAFGQGHGEIGKEKAAEVHEDVGGVREEGDGAASVGAPEFQKEGRAGERGREHENPPGAGRGKGVAVMGLGGHGMNRSTQSWGSTRSPWTVRDQWTWGPVAMPSAPVSPNKRPVLTRSPARTARARMCR